MEALAGHGLWLQEAIAQFRAEDALGRRSVTRRRTALTPASILCSLLCQVCPARCLEPDPKEGSFWHTFYQMPGFYSTPTQGAGKTSHAL